MNKTLNLLNKKWILFFFVFLISFVIRLPQIGVESINPDAVNWHYRCQQFANGLKYAQFEKTYPHYHPGVTLCYLMAVPTEVYKKITGKTYNIDTYIDFNILNTYSVVIFNSILISILAILLGRNRGLLFFMLLNLEPFFYGNSRIIHLDIIVSLLLFLSFVLLNKFLTEKKDLYLYLTSLSLAFAFLTKSVSIVFFVLFLFALVIFLRNEVLKKSTQFFVSFFLFIFLLFPAMWVDPFGTFTRIFKEADRVGVRTGHNQFFLNEFYDEDSNPGFLFYPVVSVVKLSPLILIGLFIGVFFIALSLKKFIMSKNLNLKGLLNYLDDNREFFLLTLIYAFYILLIFYSTKKVDRYLLVLVPAIIYYLTSKSSRYFLQLFVILGLLNFISILNFLPNLFYYYSPVVMNYQNVNELVGQKTFGGFMFDLKKYLVSTYGEKNIGFYDVKPMETVYPNSKVFDIRQTSSSKIDIVILSLNEKLPVKYEDKYQKVDTFYFKDIPLYEIYTKK